MGAPIGSKNHKGKFKFGVDPSTGEGVRIVQIRVRESLREEGKLLLSGLMSGHPKILKLVEILKRPIDSKKQSKINGAVKMLDLKTAGELLKAKGFEVGDFGHYDRDGMGLIVQRPEFLSHRGIFVRLCKSSNDYLNIHLLRPPFFVTSELELDCAIDACEVLYRAHLATIDREKAVPKVDEKIQNLNLLLNNLKRIQQRIDDHELRWPSMIVPIGMIKDETIASQSLITALDEYGPFVAIVGAVEKRVKINAVFDIKQATEGGHMMYLIPGCKGPISTPCQFIVAIDPDPDRASITP